MILILGLCVQLTFVHSFAFFQQHHSFPDEGRSRCKASNSCLHVCKDPLRSLYSAVKIPTVRDVIEASTDHCDDAKDDILQHLVSPAPESFHIIDASMKRLNEESNKTNFDTIVMDLTALSRYLVKPHCMLHVYEEDTKWKWKTSVGQQGGRNMLCIDQMRRDVEFMPSSAQLYHNLTTLELARCATNLATGQASPRLASISINEIVEQVVVRGCDFCSPFHHSCPSFYLTYFN